MAKNAKSEPQLTPEQEEIKNLKSELEQLRSKTQIADLKAKIEEIKDKDINSQIPSDVAMTNLPGYEEEFARLKEDVIRQQHKGKIRGILQLLGQLITIPITGIIVFFIINLDFFVKFLELDPNGTKILNIVTIAVLALIEFQTLFNLLKVVISNPQKIEDQTLSYLSLTAKEHILDPKGSVIREKYGTSKWSAVTNT